MGSSRKLNLAEKGRKKGKNEPRGESGMCLTRLSRIRLPNESVLGDKFRVISLRHFRAARKNVARQIHFQDFFDQRLTFQHR